MAHAVCQTLFFLATLSMNLDGGALLQSKQRAEFCAVVRLKSREDGSQKFVRLVEGSGLRGGNLHQQMEEEQIGGLLSDYGALQDKSADQQPTDAEPRLLECYFEQFKTVQ